MTTKNEVQGQTCACCGGDLPSYEIWEARREDADECDGSVTRNGRCRAFANDDLWTLPED